MGSDCLYCSMCNECSSYSEFTSCDYCGNYLKASDYGGCCGFVCNDCETIGMDIVFEVGECSYNLCLECSSDECKNKIIEDYNKDNNTNIEKLKS